MGRLMIAVISTLVEEIFIVILWLILLPSFNVNLPLWPLPLVMLAWLAFAVFLYRKGTLALTRKAVDGLPGVIGTNALVVKVLNPEGMVRIKGELWQAESNGETIETGSVVEVVDQKRTRLKVRRLA